MKQCEHYSGGIEPIKFIIENKYSFNRGNIVKYAHRVGNKKGQEVQDIMKIIDYALLLAYEEYIDVNRDDIIKLINYRFDWARREVLDECK